MIKEIIVKKKISFPFPNKSKITERFNDNCTDIGPNLTNILQSNNHLSVTIYSATSSLLQNVTINEAESEKALLPSIRNSWS